MGMESRHIIISTEGQEVFKYDITDSQVTVGRGNGNNIIIPDSKVSRRHCRFELRNGTSTLYDCGSKNGVFVNGVRQKQSRVFNGDQIKIGDSTLKIELTGKVGMEVPEEQTIEFDTIANCVFPDEHTQERIIFADALEGNETLVPVVVTGSNNHRKSFFSFPECRRFIQERKIYLLAVLLLCIGGSLFLFGSGHYLNRSKAPLFAPESVTEKKISGEEETTVDTLAKSETGISSHAMVTTKNRAEANVIAHEADSLNTLGRHRQALALYQKALKLDPDNVFAGTHLDLLNKQIEQLAWNYFNNGMQAYKIFEYETAINQWENVLYLLENNKKHKLYSKTVTFLSQAKNELHK
jgi:pSer/pThr/pTyr-binding forkhead associated (FHA) protein